MPNEPLEDDLPGDEDEEVEQAPRPAAVKAKPITKPAPRSAPPEEEEDEPEEPEVYRHPPSLVKLAQQVGVSRAELEATPTDQLWLMVRSLHSMHAEERRTPKPEPTPKAKADDDEELDYDIDEYDDTGAVKGKRKAKLSDYPPIVAKVYRENKALKESLEARTKADQQREEQGLKGRLDEGFEGMKGPWREFFAEGTIDELHAAGEADAIARRNAVWRESGIKPTDSQRVVDRKLAQARDRLFGKVPAAEEEEEEAGGYGAARNGTPRNGKPKSAKKPGRKERWEDGVVSRPAGRRGKELPKGLDAAEDEVRQWMVENGYSVAPKASHALEDELPGDDD